MLKDHINPNVTYNSLECENEHVFICHDKTRVKVLGAIKEWAQVQDGPRICWLYGPAGSGKSTITHTIVQQYDKQNKLTFSYFFSLSRPYFRIIDYTLDELFPPFPASV